MNAAPPLFGEGWSYEENDGVRNFRWMGREAVIRLRDVGPPGLKYLHIIASHMFPDQPAPRLEVFVGGRSSGDRILAFQFAPYLFPFKDGGDIEVRFKVDRIYPVPGDGRDHGIMVSTVSVVSPADLTEPFYGEGWHPEERDDFTPFKWMRREARVLLPSRARSESLFITIPVFSKYANLTQVLEVWRGDRLLAQASLLQNWTTFSFRLDPGRPYREVLRGTLGPVWRRKRILPARRRPSGPDDLVLSLNKIFPRKYYPWDPRELGARIGPITFHRDPERHRESAFLHANGVRNHQEMIEGRTKLESFPGKLGIDLYGRCNIKPHCVYCLWDQMKVLEGKAVDAVVDETTLESYGPFFRAAWTFVNCSIGEPLLHPRLTEILELFDKRGKFVELSTNGQAFTEGTIRALAGKRIILYISLDAATEATYAKIRNDRWATILPRLRLFAEERKKAGGLPKIYMVFIPMRVNRGDLEEYFKLAAEIGADSIILRPLNNLENPEIRADRGGYHFDYAEEMLNRREMIAVAAEAGRYSAVFGVPFQNQLDFGTVEAPEAGG